MVDAVKQPYQGDASALLDDTELASLANNAYSALSAVAIDISQNPQVLRDLELVLASAARTGTQVAVYAVPSIDGTNYCDWNNGLTATDEVNEQYYIGSFTVNATTSAARAPLGGYSCEFGGLVKLAVRNLTGVAFAATGNTVKQRRHGYASQ